MNLHQHTAFTHVHTYTCLPLHKHEHTPTITHTHAHMHACTHERHDFHEKNLLSSMPLSLSRKSPNIDSTQSTYYNRAQSKKLTSALFSTRTWLPGATQIFSWNPTHFKALSIPHYTEEWKVESIIVSRLCQSMSPTKLKPNLEHNDKWENGSGCNYWRPVPIWNSQIKPGLV